MNILKRLMLAAGVGGALAFAQVAPALADTWIPSHYLPDGAYVPGHWVGPAHVWVGGHYGPAGYWVPGHWAPAGQHWVPGYYGPAGYWHHGHWAWN